MKNLTKKIALIVFTGIIIIVFGAWGIGDLFSSGNKNVIAKIDDKKIYVKDFVNSTRIYVQQNKKNQLNNNDYSIILNKLISEKIYEKFSEDLNIKINDQALAYYIKNNDNFKEDGLFSRTKYEKYLLLNNLNASTVEEYFKKELIKTLSIQVFINGIATTNYHINKLEDEFLKQISANYYKLNVKNNITKEDIEKYFSQNKSRFSLGEMRDGNIVKLNYKSLGFKEQNDQFYKLLNNIENDLINNLNYSDLVKKYNLKTLAIKKINKFGLDENGLQIEKNEIAENLFSLNENFKTEIFDINNVKHLINLEKKYNNGEINLNSRVENEIIKILNFKKNIEISQEIIKSNDKAIFKNTANKYSLKIESIFFNNLLDNKKIFNQQNMEKIFNTKESKVIHINENNEIYLVKVKKISKNKNKIDNLNEILKSQVKQEFQSLILRDLDKYLVNKYPIRINEKVFNQIKKSL